MQKLWGIMLLGASMGMLQAQATEPRVDGIIVRNPGIYSMTVMKDIPDANTAEGARQSVGNISLVSTTTTIPAKIGVRFGFSFTVTGAPAGASVPIRYVNRFPSPGLTNPKTGETTHVEEYTLNAIMGRSNYKGWSLDNGYELVTGRWTFEIWYGNRKLGEQSFDVVRAQ